MRISSNTKQAASITPQDKRLLVIVWEAFRGRPLHWIAGGNVKSKHDPEGARRHDSEIANLKSIFNMAPNLITSAHLFGEAAANIAERLLAAGFPDSRIFEGENINDCFEQAVHGAVVEDSVLLSPLYGLPWEEANSFNRTRWKLFEAAL